MLTHDLTQEQLQAAVDAAAVAKEGEIADLHARIAYEAERDALAFSYIQADRTLPLDQAKARADAALQEHEATGHPASSASPTSSDSPFPPESDHHSES